jgi:bifunctional enzyme CysN/CysC
MASAKMTLDEFFARERGSDLLRLTIAGSVDDGKSTLIGRLLYESESIAIDQMSGVQNSSRRLGRDYVDLALLTDGLKAEREQGITIDVAYRHFSTERRRFVIADTPGHEQYTRNMATGASTADVAVILIDARNGVSVQSRRHGFISSLLGIPRVVVAINKMDLVGYSQTTFEQLQKEYEAFAQGLGLQATFIPMSALHGDNVTVRSTQMVWYDGPTFLEALEAIQTDDSVVEQSFRFPVQGVVRPHPAFRGYSGTIAAGTVHVGDKVLALPSNRRSTVKSISVFEGDLPSARAKQAVTICLADEIDVARGSMLVKADDAPQSGREFDAMMVWLNEKPLQIGAPYIIKSTTNSVRGRIAQIDYRISPDLKLTQADELQLNEIARVSVRVDRDIAFDDYCTNRCLGSFIVIDPIGNGTVGAGMITIGRRYAFETNGASSSHAKSRNIHRQSGQVGLEDRMLLLRQKPTTLWLTGLSGSGKSTIAYALEKTLLELGKACYVLDGDNIRYGLNRDLGFSAEDRTENIRRIAEVAALFNDAGVIVITAFISPYRRDRLFARATIGDANFVEVFVDAPIEECERRDPRGLYAKARSGQIQEFTGVSAPYERPDHPTLHLRTDQETPEQSVGKVVDYLRQQGRLR